MLPVLLGHVVENVVQERPARLEDFGIEVGGVGGLQLSHHPILAARTVAGESFLRAPGGRDGRGGRAHQAEMAARSAPSGRAWNTVIC
jgi:hypothetical protein